MRSFPTTHDAIIVKLNRWVLSPLRSSLIESPPSQPPPSSASGSPVYVIAYITTLSARYAPLISLISPPDRYSQEPLLCKHTPPETLRYLLMFTNEGSPIPVHFVQHTAAGGLFHL